MPKIDVWARIGVRMSLEVPDNYTEEDVAAAAKRVTEENDPGKLFFHFHGESYIPADQAGIDPSKEIIFDNDIEFDI